MNFIDACEKARFLSTRREDEFYVVAYPSGAFWIVSGSTRDIWGDEDFDATRVMRAYAAGEVI